MALTSTTVIPAGIAAQYDRNLLSRATAMLLHDKFGQQRSLKSKESESVNFRRYSNLAVATTPLVEGVTPNGSSLQVTPIPATVKQYGDFVTTTDKIQMHVEDNVIAEATDILGYQAGETLDELYRDVINAGTLANYCGGAANRAAIAADDVIDAGALDLAVLKLKRNLGKKFTGIISGSTSVGTTPIRAGYVAIVHPDVVYDLESVSGYVPVAEYANQTGIMEGEVGSYRDIRFVESTKAKMFADAGLGGTVDVYSTLVLAQDAYGVVSVRGMGKFETIVKPLGSGGSEDPLNQRATIGWKASTTAVILNDSWMVRVESSSSQGVNA